VQISAAEDSILQVSQRQAKQGYDENGDNTKGIDAENAPNHERPINGLASGTLLLPLQRKHQHQAGVDEENNHAPMAQFVKIQEAEGSVLAKKEDVKNHYEGNRGGPQEVQIWAFAVSVQ
jgi:hypothetical protein